MSTFDTKNLIRRIYEQAIPSINDGGAQGQGAESGMQSCNLTAHYTEIDKTKAFNQGVRGVIFSPPPPIRGTFDFAQDGLPERFTEVTGP